MSSRRRWAVISFVVTGVLFFVTAVSILGVAWYEAIRGEDMSENMVEAWHLTGLATGFFGFFTGIWSFILMEDS